MNLRRFGAALVALTLGASLLSGCGGTSPASSSKAPIKVGAVFILTGTNSGYGIAQRAGVELAVAEVKNGGINGAPLEVIYEDSQGNKDQAINAVRKLIDKDNVTAIIGPTLSTEMFAAGLNETESANLMDLVRRIRASGITVLIIEHDMHVVMNLCDRVAVLNFGRKIAEGSPAEVQSDPAVIEAYLGRDEDAAG